MVTGAAGPTGTLSYAAVKAAVEGTTLLSFNPANPGVQQARPSLEQAREWLNAERAVLRANPDARIHAVGGVRIGGHVLADVDELIAKVDAQLAEQQEAAEAVLRQREAERAARAAAARERLPEAAAWVTTEAAELRRAFGEVDALLRPLAEALAAHGRLVAAVADFATTIQGIEPNIYAAGWQCSEELAAELEDVPDAGTARQWLPDRHPLRKRPLPLPVSLPGVLGLLLHAESGTVLPLAKAEGE